MPRHVQITFDAHDPHALAAWWAERLGIDVETNSEMVEGLLAQGVITEEMVVRIDGATHFADAVAATDPTGTVPRMFFQRVPEAKVAKNRMHLDIHVEPDELDDEVAAWTAVGASLVEFGSHPGHRWAVMRDPEGNEFCLH
jgi:hypothetical protein